MKFQSELTEFLRGMLPVRRARKVKDKEHMVKIAVMADIHSNYLALQACIEKAIDEGVQQFIFLGDYLGEMAYPRKTISILKQLQERYSCVFIRGNKEEYWITHRKNAYEIWKDGKTTTGILKYVYDQLNDDDIDMFETMPIEKTLKYDGLPRFTICHGSPFKVNQSMRPDYEYIDNLLENMPSNLIICGHFHIQTDYVRNDVRVINPGAVGVALHSNSLAQFMTLTGKDGHWEPQFFSVGYDVDKVIDEMEKERLDFKAPGWFRMTKNLLTTGEKSIVNFISEVQQVYYKETGISDYRLIPEAFWDKVLTRLGI